MLALTGTGWGLDAHSVLVDGVPPVRWSSACLEHMVGSIESYPANQRIIFDGSVFCTLPILAVAMDLDRVHVCSQGTMVQVLGSLGSRINLGE